MAARVLVLHVCSSGEMEELADPTSTARRFISEPQFIDPMLLLRTDSLPSGEQWLYELKLDGYRVIAFKRDGAVHLRSRNDNDFNARYAGVVAALARLPDNTVIDGEVVAFDPEGRYFRSCLSPSGTRHPRRMRTAALPPSPGCRGRTAALEDPGAAR